MKKILLLFSSILCCVQCQSQEYQLHSIAFYNVENLFDTEDDPTTFDEDFTPKGSYHWTKEVFQQKIDQLATVMAGIGKATTKNPPLLIGLSEIENRTVLNTLLQHPQLQPYGYAISHFESPDSRGIDVALLYRKDYFLLENQKRYALRLVNPKTQFRTKTRDQLVVSGYFEGEYLAVLVNHWPSRRGGEKKSQPLRIKAAQLQRKIIDSLLQLDPPPKIISMGDYNDNPTNKSLKNLVNPNNKALTAEEALFNPMLPLFKKGVGSLAYNDQWHLFDQILLSSSWKQSEDLFFVKAAVYNPEFLKTPRGKYQGYPFRMKIRGNTLEGYSDHFPVYVFIAEKDQ